MTKSFPSPLVRDPSRRDGIFYVTDGGFLLPTVASALAVRRKVPLERADVRILVTSTEAPAVRRLAEFLRPAGIWVDELPAALFSGFEHRLFNETHVPISALGRFFMLDCVPDIYDRILYLDGDTWPLGDPTALLDVPLADGALAAAEDQCFFFSRETGPTGDRIRSYFARLGLEREAGYFNSGVLLADATTWRRLGAEAFAFFRANTALCLYHDQSALNAVVGSRRVRLSPRWNFAGSYYDWGVQDTPQPHVVHFCGGGKPWANPRHRFHDVFERSFKDLESLDIALASPDAEALRSMDRNIARQRLKHRTVLQPRLWARRRAYRKLVETATVA